MFDAPEHVAIWKASGRRFSWVRVKCDCGHVGVYRSRRFAQRKSIDVRCGGCEAVNHIAR